MIPMTVTMSKLIGKARRIQCCFCKKEIEPDLILENVTEIDYDYDVEAWVFYHRRCHPQYAEINIKTYEEFPDHIKEMVQKEVVYFIGILKDLVDLYMIKSSKTLKKSDNPVFGAICLQNLLSNYDLIKWRDIYECQEIAINSILHDLDPDAVGIPTHESSPLEATIMTWVGENHVSYSGGRNQVVHQIWEGIMEILDNHHTLSEIPVDRRWDFCNRPRQLESQWSWEGSFMEESVERRSSLHFEDAEGEFVTTPHECPEELPEGIAVEYDFNAGDWHTSDNYVAFIPVIYCPYCGILLSTPENP